MANAGSFVKGEKRPGQGKRGPSKATANARDAIAMLVDGNTHRLEGWLDQIAAESPEKAWRCMMDVIEYHIPKLARTELTGKDGTDLFARIESVIVDPNTTASVSYAKTGVLTDSNTTASVRDPKG